MPSTLRRRVFASVHGLAHAGVKATLRLLSRNYVWSHINADVAAWILSCSSCQLAKTICHLHPLPAYIPEYVAHFSYLHMDIVQHWLLSCNYVWSPINADVAAWIPSCLSCQPAKTICHLHPLPASIPEDVARFSCLQMDIVGPLQLSRGMWYLVTFVDLASRWFECSPLPDVSMAFVETWIQSSGVPAQLVSNRGAQFMGSLFQNLCTILGRSNSPSCLSHSEANGLVEHWHRRLKDALRTHAASEWMDILPWTVLGLRAAPRSDEDVSLFEVLFGMPPGLLRDLALSLSWPDGQVC